MNLLEHLRIALSGLAANRLRAALTTLGIIIGVGAVVGLISLGRGVERYIANEFESLGSNLLIVFSARPSSPTRTRIEPITTNEARALSNPAIAPSIRQIALQYDVPGQVIAGSNRVSASISGVSPNFPSVRSWGVRPGGSFISDEDIENNARVAVLGQGVVEDLFGSVDFDPVGTTVRINDLVFTVIGVMSPGSDFTGENDQVFVPLTTAQTRLSNARARDGSFRVTILHVQAWSEAVMGSAAAEIEAYLSEAHGVQFDGEQDFQVLSQADVLAFVSQLTGILTVFLGLIAGISLLVGGIGVMNIMLVSVTERTREIGLRKAVGARSADILTQFLAESVMLSIAGGTAGIALGWLAAQIGMAVVPDLTIVVTWDAVLLATAVSSFVGVFFGLYPASRAARMRPIDALRFE
ncbi:MAG: ABC transporter permease [Aggregatilineales bacterium]